MQPFAFIKFSKVTIREHSLLLKCMYKHPHTLIKTTSSSFWQGFYPSFKYNAIRDTISKSTTISIKFCTAVLNLKYILLVAYKTSLM